MLNIKRFAERMSHICSAMQYNS